MWYMSNGKVLSHAQVEVHKCCQSKDVVTVTMSESEAMTTKQ